MDFVYSEVGYKKLMRLKKSWSDSFNIKNKNSEVIAASTEWTLNLGYKNPIDMLGLTPYDLKCPAVDLAEDYMAQAMEAIHTTEAKTYITLAIHADMEIRPILYTREYIDECVVSNHKIIDSGLFAKYFHQRIGAMDEKYHRRIQSCYEVLDCYDGLSSRETEVLYYLMLGMSSTMISGNLLISNRTVQHAVDRIKQKFQCHSSQQLIELSLYLGLNKKIPSSFVRAYYSS